MGDGALSQELIDALFNRATNGEEIVIESQPDVKDYDFRSPKKFTRDRVKQLHSVFESYARLVSSYFTSNLRLFTKVNIMSVEEQKYYEFNNALPDYVIMGMAHLRINDEDLDDISVIVQLSNSLTFLIIDRLLGGTGKPKEADRDFTEIEITVMQGVVNDLVGILKDPWINYASLEPTLNGVETNSRIASSSMYNDTMIIAAMEVVINDTKAMISVCLPAVQLDAFMHKYSKTASQSKRQMRPIKEKERKDNLLSAVEQSSLDVSAVLGEVTLDILDVMNLQVNDIIPLRKNISSNISVKVGGKKWYDGKLGVFNNRKAIRIENIYQDSGEFFNTK